MRQSLMRRRTAPNAFTLIELLVVIVILAILATVVISKVTHRVDDAREAKAMADISALSAAVEQYKLDIGHYPPSLQGLVTNEESSEKWNKPYVASIPSDPWDSKKTYVYKSPGDGGRDFDISATTPEGKLIKNQ